MHERSLQRRSPAIVETASRLPAAPLLTVRTPAAGRHRFSDLAVEREPPIQRYCGAPGCTSPTCNDVRNHNFNAVHNLRGRTVYNFEVPPNVHRGTGTTQGTRNYVNDPTTPYPQQVAMEYSGSGATHGRTEFINAPLALGQRADAGHIRGGQNQGFGNQNAAVFPQNPQQNRGNSLHGQSTRSIWRGPEDEIREGSRQGETVNASVTLRNQPRTPYDQVSSESESDSDFEDNGPDVTETDTEMSEDDV